MHAMDIKSLIATEDTSTVRKRSRPPISNHASQNSQDGSLDPLQGQGPDHSSQRGSRPAQLSSLQTPGYQDSRHIERSPYGSNSHPNQQPHFAGLNIARYPSPQQHSQSPQNAYHPAQYSSQENRSSISTPTHLNPGPSTPITHTPTGSTPGSAGAYSSWQRPTSSHSGSTPTSAQHASHNFLRESSQMSNGISGSLHQPMSTQQIAPLPSTRLGPPSVRPRPMDVRRDSAGSVSNHPSLSGGLLGSQQIDGDLHSIFHSSSTNEPLTSQNPDRREREKSISVSPKTRLANFPPPEPPAHNDAIFQDGYRENQYYKNGDVVAEVTHSNQKGDKSVAQRATSLGIQGLLNEEPQSELANRRGSQGFHDIRRELSERSASVTVPTESHSLNQHSSQLSSTSGPSDHRTSNCQDPTSLMSVNQNLSSRLEPSEDAVMSTSIATEKSNLCAAVDLVSPQTQANSRTIEFPLASDHSVPITQAADAGSATTLSSQPAKKKPRLNSKKTLQHQEKRSSVPPSDFSDVTLQQKTKKPPRMPVPIFAQSVRTSSNNRGHPGHRGIPEMIATQQQNGHPPDNGISLHAHPPTLIAKGPLGHWEPSILNIIPTDEVVKVVSDFLFTQVLVNDGIGVTPAGSSAGKGAVLEIEAKIGRIIDKNTMDRLALPVLTETVLNREHPNMRTNFESSMTEVRKVPSRWYCLLIHRRPSTVP